MISIIVTTLGTREAELIRLFDSLTKQKSNYEVIVVSQDHHDKTANLLNKYSFSYKQVRMNERGLSRGRNEGIKHISGDIVTFSDDDCWYPENALLEVEECLKHSNCDIGCFQIFDPDQNMFYKEYPTENQNVTGKQIFRKSSIEIFVRLNNISKEELSFDVDFGLGTDFPSGEENIFLFELYKKGLTIKYFPQIVVFHKKPSLKTRLTKQQFISKGPLFKRMYNTPVAVLLLTAFTLKKVSLLENPINWYFKSLKETIQYKK